MKRPSLQKSVSTYTLSRTFYQAKLACWLKQNKLSNYHKRVSLVQDCLLQVCN
jgi:hypothetical protein